MANGLRAALSPNEETTLHRVAGGRALPEALRDDDVLRLKSLGLIEERGTHLALSALGRQRIAQQHSPQ